MTGRLPIHQPAPEVVDGAAGDGPFAAGMAPHRIFIDTFGCQMNQHDSQRMVALMAAEGYLPTEDPDEADLVVLNSCSVREKAEHKLRSAAGKYRRLKRQRKDVVFALAGCVAQQEGRALLDRVEHADIVFGPDHVGRLPDMVREVREKNVRVLETEFLDRKEYAFPPIPEAAPRQVSAFVSIMKGCDKFCTFCIVPFTRGREVSRAADEILDEVETLAAQGTREVILLGQTVNSYGRIRRDGHLPFHELVAKCAEVPGIERIRFTSPHPADFSEEQVRMFSEVPKLCPHVHLPVQSGSDAVLSAMRRGHTRAEYVELVGRLRAARPELSLTTDIIVGFPGETPADFEATLSLLEEVRFQASFSFAYSERTGTRALDLEAQTIPPDERLARLNVLQALQNRITLELLEDSVGRRVEVLVEGPSKDPSRCTGRSPQNQPVHIDGVAETGALLEVEIVEAFKHSLRARVPSQKSR